MLDERIQELIHAAYDGEIDPSDRTLLDEHLRTNEEARRYQADLHRMGELLGAAPEPMPPRELREAIITSLHESDPRRSSTPSNWLRPALALAAAILLALPIIVVMDSFDVNDTDGLTGTMVGGSTVTSQQIARQGLAAGAGLNWRDGALRVDIEITSEEAVVTSVSYPQDRFTLQPAQDLVATADGFSCESSGAKTILASLRLRDGAVQGSDPIRVTFSQEGKAVDTIELAIPPAD